MDREEAQELGLYTSLLLPEPPLYINISLEAALAPRKFQLMIMSIDPGRSQEK